MLKAIALNQALGKDLVEDFTDIQGEGVVSLAGRLKSFPENWTGTPVMTLAQAGMYYKEGIFSAGCIFSLSRDCSRER